MCCDFLLFRLSLDLCSLDVEKPGADNLTTADAVSGFCVHLSVVPTGLHRLEELSFILNTHPG